MERAGLAERLRSAGLIDASQVRLAELEQHRFGSLAEALVRLGFLTEADLVRAVCRFTQTPAIDLAAKRIEPEVLSLVSAEAAHKHRCLPLFVSMGPSRRVLFLGIENPAHSTAPEEIARSTGLEQRVVVVGPVQLTMALERFYPTSMWGGVGTHESVVATDTLPLADSTPRPEAAMAMEVPAVDNDADSDEGHEVPTRVILQALTKLLTARGVIDRADLVAEIRALSEGVAD